MPDVRWRIRSVDDDVIVTATTSVVIGNEPLEFENTRTLSRASYSPPGRLANAIRDAMEYTRSDVLHMAHAVKYENPRV